MPQQQLASAAGVDISTVQRLEAGGVARLSTIRKLADALGVEPRDLMAQPPAP
jgi:transcriptional regulator with XRE-family HTH domain